MIKKLVILLIKGYRLLISPFLGSRCRFYPSCSAYAVDAIDRHGVFGGGILAVKRLFKCHPWYKKNGYDPVPEKIKRERYDR